MSDNLITSKWKLKFFSLTFGQSVSLIGSSAVQFALIWWLSSESGSALLLSLAGIAAFIPQMLLGPFAGVWIDRARRKLVAIISDLSMGVAALIFSICFLFFNPPFWSVCLILFVRGVGGVFQTPAIQALVPLLVPKEKLMKANGWSQFLQSGAFMLGPVLGAAMYSILPLYAILLTDIIGAVFASVLLAIVKIDESSLINLNKTEKPHFISEFKIGLKTLVHEKKLFILLIGSTLAMLFFFPLATLYPLVTSSHFNLSAMYGSIVELLYAAGMLAVSFLLGSCLKIKHPILGAYIGLFGIGIFSLIAGLLPSDFPYYFVFCGACFFMGASSNLYNIPLTTYMQATIAPDKLGRVFSIMGSLMSFAMPLGLLVAGPIAEKFGVSSWFIISGIAVMIITTAFGLILKFTHTDKPRASVASDNAFAATADTEQSAHSTDMENLEHSTDTEGLEQPVPDND